jgi:hypothetical protein
VMKEDECTVWTPTELSVAYRYTTAFGIHPDSRFTHSTASDDEAARVFAAALELEVHVSFWIALALCIPPATCLPSPR